MSAPFGRTRRVEGGLRARSARGQIGESWWSKRFLAVLESFALGSRLTRGRSYARAGQVLSLSVAPGLVKATVQGSRPKPYDVRIGLAVFPDDVWADFETAVAAQALFSARLLAGELPPEIEDVLPVFPRALRDLSMKCSCPDSAVPCKHIAATFYLLAEEFDTDPFQILTWRGRTREALLAHLGSTSREAPAEPLIGDLPSPPIDESAERYWLPPVPFTGPQPTLPTTATDLVLRTLPTPPGSLGGARLAPLLARFYERLAADDSPA
jgi:uncharacterized Zn finger protein